MEPGSTENKEDRRFSESRDSKSQPGPTQMDLRMARASGITDEYPPVSTANRIKHKKYLRINKVRMFIYF